MKILLWYITLLLLGISTLPITFLLFKNFNDDGYIFSKPLGILLSGSLMWLLSRLHILKFTTLNSYVSLILIFIISMGLVFFRKNKDSNFFIDEIKKKWKIFLLYEIAFLLVFLGCCYIKSFNAEAYGTEKLMDYGFMKVIEQTDYMPPKDMWFSGEVINYYYLGQYFATFITNLSGTGIEYGYNFMLITIASLGIVGYFSIVHNLLGDKISEILERKGGKKHNPNDKKDRKFYFALSIIGAVVSALAINLAGNMHYVIYGILKLPGITGRAYYFPDSTRFIGCYEQSMDSTIHEFPSYSYILGDLHAHVINIIFVMLLIALLLAFVINNKKLIKGKIDWLKDLLQPELIFAGALIGVFKTVNYWDYPIYAVVTFLVLFFINLRTYQNKRDWLLITLAQIVGVFAVSYIVSIPFMIDFQKISSKICLVEKRSDFWQLAVIWGLPVIIVAVFIVYTIYKAFADKDKNNKGKKNKDKKKENFFMKYINNLSFTDIFIIILGCSAIGLIIAPEIVFIKDIYEGAPRANTMFKLTYQSYIMFGVCSGYILAALFTDKKLLTKIISCMLTIVLSTTFFYSVYSSNEWFIKHYKGLGENVERTLDGSDFLETAYPSASSKDDKKVIDWINENTDASDVVLEAGASDFTYANIVSSFTGRQTVLGWPHHEWLWRSVDSSVDMPENVHEREEDVRQFFTSGDAETMKSIIEKYNIKYVVVGQTERTTYGAADQAENTMANSEAAIKSLGEVVFETNVSGLENPTYIVKVN